jgi:hypothetical protein
MITIKDESILQARYPFQIDNMSPRYRTKTGLYTFTSPSLWVIQKNIFYLLVNATKVPFDNQYNYKPSYLSYDNYGVTTLDYLLMYINNTLCVEEFCDQYLTTVVIPAMDAIVDICQEKYPQISDTKELEMVNL